MKAILMDKASRSLALAALLMCGGCSSLRFEPPANWLQSGGTLCDRDTPFGDWDRAAPRACDQAHPAMASAYNFRPTGRSILP